MSTTTSSIVSGLTPRPNGSPAATPSARFSILDKPSATALQQTVCSAVISAGCLLGTTSLPAVSDSVLRATPGVPAALGGQSHDATISSAQLTFLGGDPARGGEDPPSPAAGLPLTAARRRSSFYIRDFGLNVGGTMEAARQGLSQLFSTPRSRPALSRRSDEASGGSASAESDTRDAPARAPASRSPSALDALLPTSAVNIIRDQQAVAVSAQFRRAAIANLAALQAAFPLTAQALAAQRGVAPTDFSNLDWMPIDVLARVNDFYMQQWGACLIIRANVIEQVAMGPAGRRLASAFEHFDATAAAACSALDRLDLGEPNWADYLGLPVGRLALHLLLSLHVFVDPGLGQALRSKAQAVSLGDVRLDINGVAGLRDALTRVVAAGASVDYHAIVSILVSKISRARGFVFENNDLGHSWPQFAAKTVGSFGDMEAAQTTFTCGHVSAIVENLGAFEDAVIRAEAFACRMASLDADACVMPVCAVPGAGQPPALGAASTLTAAVAPPLDTEWAALRADVQALTLLVSQRRGPSVKSHARDNKDNNKSRRPCWNTPACTSTVSDAYLACDNCFAFNPKLRICLGCGWEHVYSCVSKGCSTTTSRGFEPNGKDGSVARELRSAYASVPVRRQYCALRKTRAPRPAGTFTVCAMPDNVLAAPPTTASSVLLVDDTIVAAPDVLDLALFGQARPLPDLGGAGATPCTALPAAGAACRLRAPVTVVPGVPSLLAELTFTDAGFVSVSWGDGGSLYDPWGRSYPLRRAPGGRLTLEAQALRSSGSQILGVGYPAGSGVPISLLYDSGAELAVFSSEDAKYLTQRLGRPGRSVVGVGGSASSVDSGFVDFVFFDSIKVSPARLPRALYGGVGSGPLTLDSSPAGVCALSTSRRAHAGAAIRDARTVCSRFHVWNQDYLKLFPTLVDGVAAYSPSQVADALPSRLATFHKAAQRRLAIHRSKNSASSAVADLYAKGEFWWVDWSAPHPPDSDGNTYTLFAFEDKSQFVVLDFAPTKSADSFIHGLENLDLRVRSILPGTVLRRISGDFDPAWAVQGRPTDILPAPVRRFVLSRRDLVIVPMPPYSPELNRAEPNVGRLNAFAYANALLANFDMLRAWSDMLRGAELQSNLQPITVDGRLLTRYEALTGRRFDVSRVLGRPGQLAWIVSESGKPAAGRPKVISGYYICPDPVVPGHWVRRFGDMGATLSRNVVVIEDDMVRGALACRSNLTKPQGLLEDPSPGPYVSAIDSLLRPFAPSDVDALKLHTLAIRHDPVSGAPREVVNFVPATDPDGQLLVVPESCTALSGSVKGIESQDSAARLVGSATSDAPPQFYHAPFTPSATGPRLDSATKAWFRALPGDTPIQIVSDPTRRHVHADGTANPSSIRRLAFKDAKLKSDLGVLVGQRALDVWWDLARGTILVGQEPPHPAKTHLAADATHVTAPNDLVCANSDDPPDLVECSDSDSDDDDTPSLVACSDSDDDYAPLARRLSMTATCPTNPASDDDGLPGLVDCVDSDSDDDGDYDLQAVSPGGRQSTFSAFAYTESIHPRLVAVDSTLAAIKRFQSLEDGKPTADPGSAAMEGLLSSAATPLNSVAANILAVHLNDNYDGDEPGAGACNINSFLPPVQAAAYTVRGVGTRAGALAKAPSSELPPVPTSVRNASELPTFEGPGGWREAIQSEVSRVHSFGALKIVPSSAYHEALRKYGSDHVSIAHIVTAFRDKYRSDGSFEKHKARLAVADAKGNSQTLQDFYSACADASSDKILSQLCLNMGGVQHTVDVSAAYYRGTPRRPEEGGRMLFAYVPTWLANYGDFPTHDEHGRRNLLHIDANMPGKRDAGRTWEEHYDNFLVNVYGMTQCVYDLRAFYKATETGLIYVHVHVDDTRITASSPELVWDFVAAWKVAFQEDVECDVLSEHFVGVHHRRVNEETFELTCGATLDSLAAILVKHPLAAGISTQYPLSPSAMSLLHAGPSESNPLLPELVPAAGQIAGTVGFIAGVRFDVLLSFCVLSRHVSAERLTAVAWRELLRMAHYLVATRDLALTLRKATASCQLQGWVDSALGNDEDGRSFGGFYLGFPGSGAVLASCSSPGMTAESSGAVELVQGVRCIKAALGVRIFLRELGVPPSGPTVLHTDAKVLVDGTRCRKVSKEMKFVATRYAIARKSEADGATVFDKIDTEENGSDILTKPLAGSTFIRHRAAILGLHMKEDP